MTLHDKYDNDNDDSNNYEDGDECKRSQYEECKTENTINSIIMINY